MSTTPLPPLPPYFQRLDLGGYAYTGEQMQSYAQQARADLEAENARLREALQRIVDWDEAGMALTQDHIDGANAALKGTP